MAVTETNTKNQAYAVVTNGQDSSGNIVTVEDNLGTLSTDVSAWDSQKAHNIATALAELVGTNVLYNTKRVATFSIVGQ